MAQVTLYLDDKTQDRMKRAAASAGISQSKWVAELIRVQTCDDWPLTAKELAGQWTNFPEITDIRASHGADLGREPV